MHISDKKRNQEPQQWYKIVNGAIPTLSPAPRSDENLGNKEMPLCWRYSGHYNYSTDVWRGKCTFSCKRSHLWLSENKWMDTAWLSLKVVCLKITGVSLPPFSVISEQPTCQWINNDVLGTHSYAKQQLEILNLIHTSHLKKSMIFKDAAVTYSSFVKEETSCGRDPEMSVELERLSVL